MYERVIRTLLIILIANALYAAPSQAQMTPNAYCATLPSSACELLNIEPAGLAWPSGSGWGSDVNGAVLIKYCKGSTFRVLPSFLWVWLDNSGNNATFLKMETSTCNSAEYGSFSGAFVGGSSFADALSSSAICGCLP